MGGMAGIISLRVGGAADGRAVHFRWVPAEPGAMFAWGRIRTFGTERVDMVGGLGMVGGQLRDAARSGPVWLCSGSTLQYSTFRSLLQGTVGRDCGTVVAGGRWPVAGGRLPVAGCQLRGTGGDGWRRAGIAQARWHYFPVADALAGDAQARWHSSGGGVAGGIPPHKGGPERPDRP